MIFSPISKLLMTIYMYINRLNTQINNNTPEKSPHDLFIDRKISVTNIKVYMT